MSGPVDALAEDAASAGLVVRSLRGFFAEAETSRGIVLGHALVEPKQCNAAVALLARLWQGVCAGEAGRSIRCAS
jgi:DNA-binding transcriptional MocR family regulator